MDINVILVAEIMNDVTQTNEWSQIQTGDPYILKAEKSLYAMLNLLRQHVPEAVVENLEGVALELASAHIHAAIRYGIHVADAIRDAAARSADLSWYILKCVKEYRHED